MKKIFCFIFVIIITLIFSLNSFAQKTEKTVKAAAVKEAITKGELVDVLGYLKTGKVEKSLDILTKSAKNGNAFGVLSNGKIYFIFSNDANAKVNEQILPYLTKKVIVIGQVISKAGANVIMMSSIDTDKKAK